MPEAMPFRPRVLLGNLEPVVRLGMARALEDYGCEVVGGVEPTADIVSQADPTTAAGRHAPIVDVVVTIGRRLGLAVVAEGVSTREQRALLEEYGCTYAQGELFGGPMPAELVETRFPNNGTFRHVGEVDSRREIRHG